MKDFIKDMPLVSGLLGILFIGIISLLLDGFFCKKIPFKGIVIDKYYKAASSSTGVGVGTTSSGQVGTIITSSSESEKFLLMVEISGGDIMTVECPAKLYYSKKQGATLSGYWYKGLLYGTEWGFCGLK